MLALLLVAGCSFGESEFQTIKNSCANDAGCPEGVLCDDHICIDDSGVTIDVAIEVLRDPADVQLVTPASWVVGPESFSRSSTRDVVLPAIREVRGVVRWDGLPVPATLRFVRRMAGSVAPLTPVPVEVDTLRETAGGDGPEGYDFSTVLVVGETYDVTVLPSSDLVAAPMEASVPAIRSLPPLYLELPINDGDFIEPLRFDVVFPADLANACANAMDTGCELKAKVLSSDLEMELPEAGLQVRAIDRETGRVVSSIGETDESGDFAIRIGDTKSDYLLRVTSSASGDPFPAVSAEPALAFAGEPIDIPRLKPVLFSGRVRDTTDRPVAGATVRFLSTTDIFGGSQPGLEGSFSGSATTDEEGSFRTALLPGEYAIAVTPPEDVENTWGVLSAESQASQELTEAGTLIVPSQFSLRGSVTTFSDESAAGVTILARARQTEDLGAMHRSQETVSDDLGAFAMSVDSGLYDMYVKMSSETGFAWLVEPELVMGAELGDLERGYRLDPPIPIRGVIRSSDAGIVPNALIRAYVFTSAEGGASRPIQVAETVSGEDGSYRLLIAPRLDDE
jgi:hypothetical protein